MQGLRQDFRAVRQSEPFVMFDAQPMAESNAAATVVQSVDENKIAVLNVASAIDRVLANRRPFTGTHTRLGDAMRKTLWMLILIVAVIQMGGCMSEPSERFVIDKQVQLSPGHRAMPYAITRASNGDLIVIGSNELGDSSAWATRLSPTGERRWEFIQGGPDGWNDHKPQGQKFYGAIELPDQATLLCGVKKIDRRSTIVLDTLAKDGSLISEKLLPPIREGTVLSLFACRQWNDGVALFGSVSGDPKGEAWFAKLDMNLNTQWMKWGGIYGVGDTMYKNGSLYALGEEDQKPYAVKFGVDGEVTAKHLLSEGEHHFVRAGTGDPRVRIVTLVSTLQTEVLDFDDELRGPTHTLNLKNAGVQNCLGLPDGTLAIFGSQFTDSATAAITRVYNDGGYKSFLVQPLHQSPWYIDAVLTGSGNEIAAVRQGDSGYPVVDFLSFK